MSDNIPLQIVRSWISVLTLGTKGTNVAGRLMHETVADHLILALEALPTFGTGARLDRAIMWATLRVNVGVRAEYPSVVAPIEARVNTYLRRYCVWNGGAVQPG